VCGPNVLDGHCLDYRAIAGGTVVLAMRKQSFLHRLAKDCPVPWTPSSTCRKSRRSEKPRRQGLWLRPGQDLGFVKYKSEVAHHTRFRQRADL
jgi:hypothetical protein